MEAPTQSSVLERVRMLRPLVHHITNCVTVNDCANVTLCAGGSPIMADAPEEIGEVVGMADALVLNIGTLSAAQVEAMLLAGKAANGRGIPVVFDPVGAGATRLRTDTALRILDRVQVAVLKGNAGEIGTLAGIDARMRGVDSAGFHGDPGAVCRRLARDLGCTVAMSGAVDTVSDGKRVASVANGHPLMGSVSGTGCMASSVVGVFTAAGEDRFGATVAALAAFGIAGERAAENAAGPASFKVALLDALAGLEPSDLDARARILHE